MKLRGEVCDPIVVGVSQSCQLSGELAFLPLGATRRDNALSVGVGVARVLWGFMRLWARA